MRSNYLTPEIASLGCLVVSNYLTEIDCGRLLGEMSFEEEEGVLF